MNVPEFRASQTGQHVLLDVKLPSECLLEDIKVVLDASEAQATQQGEGGAQEQIFGLTCPPYYLPLVFAPNALLGGSFPSSGTDSPTSTITLERIDGGVQVSLSKAKAGEELAGLDMLKAQVFPGAGAGEEAQRLQGLAMLQRGVELMNAPDTGVEAEVAQDDEAAGGLVAKGRPMTMPISPRIPKGTNSKLHECFSSELTEHQKLVGHLARDDERFDEGMYMENYVDPEGEIASLLTQVNLTPPSCRASARNAAADRPVDGKIDFAIIRPSLLILLQLIVATVYDRLTTYSDPSPESGWTIATLCPSLVSSLDLSASSGTASKGEQGWTLETLRLLFRRMLSRPLHRSWKLAEHVTRLAIKGVQERPLDWLAVSRDRLTEYAASSNEQEVVETYLHSPVEPLMSILEAGIISPARLRDLAEDASTSLAQLSKDAVGGVTWQLEALEAAADEAVASGEGGWV